MKQHALSRLAYLKRRTSEHDFTLKRGPDLFKKARSIPRYFVLSFAIFDDRETLQTVRLATLDQIEVWLNEAAAALALADDSSIEDGSHE